MCKILILIFAVTICLGANQSSEDILDSEGFSSWKALLHYKDNTSIIDEESPFFISKMGYKEPLLELNATIDTLKRDKNASCRYPARLDFLLEYNLIKQDELLKTSCEEYETYLKKVPFDSVYFVFTAEDHSRIESLMGHSFIKIIGLDDEGVMRSHSFLFTALIFNDANVVDYARALFGGIDGSYQLAPYSAAVDTYVNLQKRSLWEFELNLSPKAKTRLRKHMWELKSTPIVYKFITNNCNTAVEMVLGVADKTFSDDKYWLFSTPVEYLQELSRKDKIKSVSMQPSKNDKEGIARFGVHYPLDMPSASRMAIEGFDGGFRLSMLPSYRDKRTISNSSAIEYDSKIFELIVKFDKEGVNLERFNLIAMESIGDYRIIGLSKVFRLALEESRQKYLGGVFEWGRGVGFSPLNGTTVYTMGKIGAIYDGKADFFAAANTGIITYLGANAKLLASYEYFWDSNVKYRDFKKQLNIFAVYAPLSLDWDIYTELELKHDEINSRLNASIGFSIYF
ncbi:MAG: DUF4105 domain-containing protein [Campylobacteraceae bacterium]|nr:DUF4105 domain-containing protein [Campylobacteraceae bacterium]